MYGVLDLFCVARWCVSFAGCRLRWQSVVLCLRLLFAVCFELVWFSCGVSNAVRKLLVALFVVCPVLLGVCVVLIVVCRLFAVC